MQMVIDMDQGAKIKVIGVGGGGGNAVQNMINSGLEGVSFVCANTDKQALDRSHAEVHVQLGKQLTRGLGAGGKPEVGRQAAEEDIEEVRNAIGEADMVFVTAGMGGGTGTGAAPVIARAARERGVLTVGVVTKPFTFEGGKRLKSALEGIEALREQVDSLVIVPNDRLLTIAPKNAKITEMLKKADDVLYDAVRGVTDLITKPGLINADFADVRTVMSCRGMALMGEGRASGDDRALEAAKRAITSPLLEDLSITGCQAMLVNISANDDLTLTEYSEAASYIEEAARGPNGEEPEIIVAMSLDESCGDEIRITVIATGIETAPRKAAPAANPRMVSGRGVSAPAAPREEAEEAPRGGRSVEDILNRMGHRENDSPAQHRVSERSEVPYQAPAPAAPRAEAAPAPVDDFTFEEDDTPALFRK